MRCSIEEFFTYSDRIPLICTLTNIVNLVAKYIFENPNISLALPDSYANFIQKKSTWTIIQDITSLPALYKACSIFHKTTPISYGDYLRIKPHKSLDVKGPHSTNTTLAVATVAGTPQPLTHNPSVQVPSPGLSGSPADSDPANQSPQIQPRSVITCERGIQCSFNELEPLAARRLDQTASPGALDFLNETNSSPAKKCKFRMSTQKKIPGSILRRLNQTVSPSALDFLNQTNSPPPPRAQSLEDHLFQQGRRNSRQRSAHWLEASSPATLTPLKAQVTSPFAARRQTILSPIASDDGHSMTSPQTPSDSAIATGPLITEPTQDSIRKNLLRTLAYEGAAYVKQKQSLRKQAGLPSASLLMQGKILEQHNLLTLAKKRRLEFQEWNALLPQPLDLEKALTSINAHHVQLPLTPTTRELRSQETTHHLMGSPSAATSQASKPLITPVTPARMQTLIQGQIKISTEEMEAIAVVFTTQEDPSILLDCKNTMNTHRMEIASEGDNPEDSIQRHMNERAALAANFGIHPGLFDGSYLVMEKQEAIDMAQAVIGQDRTQQLLKKARDKDLSGEAIKRPVEMRQRTPISLKKSIP